MTIQDIEATLEQTKTKAKENTANEIKTIVHDIRCFVDNNQEALHNFIGMTYLDGIDACLDAIEYNTPSILVQ